ncbi:ABC transporter related [Desulfatibacillum aliphaticivorans]|uniref:ABC transporter related n=1 Tax=Desulfatibacillum aliphaticivorans TaxID=218208 RepID=B8FF20_DESAL|nr:ABC-F family ATP-binding cassette domain-containing protein [Desulfatibacillum aliphaticivorans]ACL03837.1 ABC transporter related [Desulfatibacillum aliphaticivorans]
MSLLVVNNLSLSFGGRTIFENLTFQVSEKDRIGLIGRNGTGKTSLMRIMVDEAAATAGEVRVTKGMRLGYLAQDISDPSDETVLQSVLEAVPGRVELDKRMERLEEALSQAEDQEEQAEIGHKIAKLAETLTDFETQYAKHAAEQILSGLGFLMEDMDRPLAELSGGWRMRAALAGLLFQKPDILLMDEPTNHLDMDSVRWLGQFLERYEGALILVCHDREFLNSQINRVISFEMEGVRQYRGDYESYLSQRAEEEQVLERQAKKQEQRVKDAMKFVEKFRYKATKARQAQSKLKLVEKMEMIKTHAPQKSMSFSFPEVPRSSQNVVTAKGLTKAFGDHVLYKGVRLNAQRGDRIAIIGRNGAGKTTLLKIFAGEMKAGEGQVDLGHGVSLSYYAQHQAEQLEASRSIVEEVFTAVPKATQTFVRSVCGAFLFSGDEVDKQVGVLSGGEKARVALAKLLVNPGNCLLMDEPTNHLDIVAAEMLTDALKDYNGTLIFVSHNQSFVKRLATKIWDIKNQTIEEYPGTLTEYFDHLDRLEEKQEAQGRQEAKPAQAEDAADPAGGTRAEKKARKQAEARIRQLRWEKIGPIQKRVQEAEKKISKLEAREAEISELLADPDVFSDSEKSQPLLEEYQKVKDGLDNLMTAWEADQEAIEELEAQLQAELDA